MRKWCKNCAQRLQVMKPDDTCQQYGWIWEKETEWELMTNKQIVAALNIYPDKDDEYQPSYIIERDRFLKRNFKIIKGKIYRKVSI